METQGNVTGVRAASAELDSILGRPYPVLSEGFVRVVDYMGNDASIVQAARVSYGGGTKRLREDEALIRHLMRESHTTPFEMCEIKLHIRAPMDCWRQWLRHRTANVNEYSTRYSVAIDAMSATAPEAWRLQSTDNRQGSEGFLDSGAGARLTAKEAELQAHCRRVYEERLGLGVAREQARKDLPLSTFTEAYWKIDLHNLLHFLQLRMSTAAQYEIRQYAQVIGNEIVSRWVPLSWKAFVDYRLQAMRLSRMEVEAIERYSAAGRDGLVALLIEWGWIVKGAAGAKPGREARELKAKLGRMGIEVSW